MGIISINSILDKEVGVYIERICLWLGIYIVNSNRHIPAIFKINIFIYALPINICQMTVYSFSIPYKESWIEGLISICAACIVSYKWRTITSILATTLAKKNKVEEYNFNRACYWRDKWYWNVQLLIEKLCQNAFLNYRGTLLDILQKVRTYVNHLNSPMVRLDKSKKKPFYIIYMHSMQDW